MTSILSRQNRPALAYHHFKPEKANSLTPLIFLGGFRSDMEGTKAIYLQDKCINQDREFVRFDYSGHGKSEGKFEECLLSDWAQDCIDIINHCFDVPAVIVGSSMGGWISFIVAQKTPEKIAGLLGLAAAPDFTQWIEIQLNDKQRDALANQGYFDLENDYGAPYAITKALLEDGLKNSLLHKKIKVDFPIHLIQGKIDADVPWQTAEKIKNVFVNSDLNITYIEQGDHRLSKPQELDIIWGAVEKLLA